MIVNPNTGLPMEASTMGGQYGVNAIDSMGIDAPLAQELLANMPTVSHTMGWNIHRTANTMTKGVRKPGIAGFRNVGTRRGYAASRMGIGRGGEYRGRGIRSTFSPLRVDRLGSIKNIEPHIGTRGYTPFNFLADNANKIIGSKGRTGAALSSRLGPAGIDGTWVSPGTLGRVASMGRIYGASSKGLAKMAPHIQDAFSTLNPVQFQQAMTRNIFSQIPTGGYGSAARGSLGLGNTTINLAGRNELGQMAGMSMRGSLSQKAAGYIHASKMTRMGITDASSLAAQGSNFAAGASKFASHREGGPIMSRVAAGARFAPGALRAAGIVGYVLLARDLAKMTGKVFASAARTAIDAGNSVKGSLDKPIMGMGFRDNTVAATSRARGVAAIQNSRLNMRSALGSEASAIHAAWG